MAIFHLTTKMLSRGKGQSAIAAAAYRSGERLYDEQAAQQKYYPSRDERIIFTDIMAPAMAPEWVHDRDQLWNQVERAEKRKDAQLAREIEIGLPHELTDEQRTRLIKDFAREQFIRKGFAVDIAIHAPDRDSDKRNYHAHLLITTRRIGPDGLSLTKESDAERRAKRNAGWTREKELGHWRKQWEHLANRHLERYGHDARIDHRSLKDQGIDREPTVHLGYAANEMAARGAQSDRMDAMQKILARNEIRVDLHTITTQLASLEKQLANERQQQAAQAQRASTDNGQHRALAAAWASRRRHDAAAQIARVQSAAPTPTPAPKVQKAKLIARPVPAPVPAPEPKPHQVRPAARAAMEQKPTPEPQRQQTANAPEASTPPPRPEPRPEIVQQAKAAPRPAQEQIPAAGQIPASAQHLQGEHRPDADMLRRMGWQWSEGLGRWEKGEERAARATPSEKPAPLREAQAPAPAPVPTPARASVPTPAAAQARAPTPVPAAREPEKTKAPEPQQWGYSSKGKHVTTGFGVFTPIEQINAAHRAAEQAAAKAREEQQRQKDLAELARAARADEAKLRSPGVSFKGLFEAKAAEAIRDDAQKIRAQVRDERHDQVQAKWQNWAQAQNPDRVTPRQVVGSAAQVGKQAVRSGFRVANRATGAVSSLGDFVGNLLSFSPARPPEQPNRIDMRTLTSDPEARRQYNLAQHAEAKRRGIAVEALDNIQRDIAAGRDLSAADVSNLPREQLVQIASKGDAYVRELIESSRKRADEYWKGRERERD